MLLSSPSILITDDDLDFRETLRIVFEPRGFRTLLASNGEEALAIVQSQPVHLLLLDMHMPKLTGLETIRRVKQFQLRLPCILISAASHTGMTLMFHVATRAFPSLASVSPPITVRDRRPPPMVVFR